MFCIPGATVDGVPAVDVPVSAARTFVAPHKAKQLRKRQSMQQTFVKCKNTKLDNDSARMELQPYGSSVESHSLAVFAGPSLSHNNLVQSAGMSSALSDVFQEVPARNVRDTLELHRARRARNARKLHEKRRSLMESHFGAPSSLLQKRINFVGEEGGSLQTPRPAVFRSSSTACISPVRKTDNEHRIAVNFLARAISTPQRNANGRQSTYANCRDVHDSNGSNSVDEPLYASVDGNDGNGLHCNNSDAHFIKQTLFRPRSKSFTNREVLPDFSLVNLEPHYVSTHALDASIVNRGADKKFFPSESLIGDRTYNPSTSSPETSSSGSLESVRSADLQGTHTNTNNDNILTEAHINVQTDFSKKVGKYGKKKLKGSKKLSKSLHALFPIACSGSVTLHHHDESVCTNPSDSFYQSINQFQARYQKIEHQPTLYHSSDNPLSQVCATKTPLRSKSLSAVAISVKRQPAQISASDPLPFPSSLNTNTKRTRPSLSKAKSMSLKALTRGNFFSCVTTKDLWYNKLAQVIAEEKESTPPTTNIQVSYYDPATSADICKTVNITSNTNARECVTLILDHLEMSDADATKFQLWVKTPSDDSPYPLIGHEFPFSIKYNCTREAASDGDHDQACGSYGGSADAKCQFILRQERKLGVDGQTPLNGGKKVSKKARKSPIRIHKVFKRSTSKGDSLDGPAPSPPGILFGHPLVKLFEKNNSTLPKPIMDMMTQLFQKGPFTVGIFRKSANARLVRELREKLDSGCPSDFSTTNITAVAALLKEFLRTLPDALLSSQLYDQWLEIPSLPTVRDQISQVLLLCSRLPRANLVLLQHFLCVLHHISRRASQNMMPASNLALCVGHSLLWPTTPMLAFGPEASKQTPSVMEFLIEHFGEIFGEAMLRLMGEPPELDPTRQDSGAEESDSLHSGHSLHSCNGRRDDSSIDSLERDIEGELSPLPRKDKMSLTNLSRDSGLTMSDTQLYTADEEESESTSSGHSSGDKNATFPDQRTLEGVQHYPAPNNPNAIYTAVCRRPDKTTSYDDSENYYATPSRDHTRVHITYSTPSYTMGGSDRSQDIPMMTYDGEGIYSVPSNDYRHIQLLEMENINSNFQRDDWMRRKSNFRKVSKTNSAESSDGLTRSTSEESLRNKYPIHEYGMSLGAGETTSPRSPSEGRIMSPDCDDDLGFMSRDSAIRRSRSAHFLGEVRKEKLKDQFNAASPMVRSASQDTMAWLKSRSTPHIHDEGDRSYDSSTLSDDDSTPHVSRSNSRGKECGSGSQAPSDSGNSRNSSFKSERTGSVCTVVSAGSCSTLSSSNPPSYEEALNRRSLMQQQGGAATPPHLNEFAIREEKLKSARARQLYADSLRLYQKENVFGDIVRASPAHAHDVDETDCPPPLPPKKDPPPLPPKQKLSRRGVSDSAGRLKHLPPVHVEMQSRKQKQGGTTMHKTIIHTDVGPPNLPPKERTVIEVVESSGDRDKVRHHTVLPMQTVEKKSIETQTDDYDEDLRDDDSPLSDSWHSDHITSVQVVPDNTYSNYGNGYSSGSNSSNNNNINEQRTRGRSRRKNSSASQRSRSVPSRDEVAVLQSTSESEDEDWDYLSSQVYPGSVCFGMREYRSGDQPEMRSEISWSVSQLRAIFGETQNGGTKGQHPPPYRPPPTSGRAPITTYHLGAGDAFCRKPSRPQSSYGEESYV